jgi:hypothetical protein
MEALWKEAIRRSEGPLTAEALVQLHQVELFAGVEGGDELRLAAVSGSLRTRMNAAAIKAQPYRAPTPRSPAC